MTKSGSWPCSCGFCGCLLQGSCRPGLQILGRFLALDFRPGMLETSRSGALGLQPQRGFLPTRQCRWKMQLRCSGWSSPCATAVHWSDGEREPLVCVHEQGVITREAAPEVGTSGGEVGRRRLLNNRGDDAVAQRPTSASAHRCLPPSTSVGNRQLPSR